MQPTGVSPSESGPWHGILSPVTTHPIRRRPGGDRGWLAAEFFAGIGLAGVGMARAGITTVWSNDIAASKKAMFDLNVADESHTFLLKDLGQIDDAEVPSGIDLAWASFPCTDLSIAGGRAGLHRGAASSTFWHFIKVLSAMGDARPAVVALENVTAFASSHDGRDIASAIKALNGLGYSMDVVKIDAIHFVPQSRPRLFLVGTLHHPAPTADIHDLTLRPTWLDSIFNDGSLTTHRMALPALPAAMTEGLGEYLEPMSDDDSRWWPEERVAAYVESLTDMQRERYEDLRVQNGIHFRTAYRRMRSGVPRWEMRSDGVAGCLRTSSGGSSKQAVVVLGNNQTKIRWMTPREYASLMGAPDFPLDGVALHHAYCGFGDAVCAPAVTWLSHYYLVPLLVAADQAFVDREDLEATGT